MLNFGGVTMALLQVGPYFLGVALGVPLDSHDSDPPLVIFSSMGLEWLVWNQGRQNRWRVMLIFALAHVIGIPYLAT